MRQTLMIPTTLTCAFVNALPVAAEIIHVNAEASGADSGESWKDAHCDLQTALWRAQNGDEIWVAEATYRPTQNSRRDISFVLNDGVAMYGGFAAIEKLREERDPGQRPTILSGNIGDPDSSLDNTYRVIEAVDRSLPPIVDGFVIREAYNEREGVDGRGGGVYNVRTDIQVSGCTIEDNYATYGAGMWNESASPHFERCVLRRNEKYAVVNWIGGNGQFVDCEFSDNLTSGRGAAFNAWTYTHTTMFIRCTFFRNLADDVGAVYDGFGDPVFEGCLFFDNKTKTSGGVAYLQDGSAVFANCTVYGNRAGFNGGGIVAHGDTPTPTLTNCLIWNNRSKRDSVVENNQIIILGGTINYSCVEGWTGRYGGAGNFGDDPQFVDADKENFRLRDDSPCFDAGDDSVVTQPTDLDGNPRILGARVDIGCYESLCPAIVAVDLKCTNSGKLKATATTTLPDGATVRFTQPDAQGRPRFHPAGVNRSGVAVAKWHPDSDAPVCMEGCSAPCERKRCP